MMYVSISGLERYAGALAEESRERYGESITYYLGECEDRMLAYITPNTPGACDEVNAFCEAVYSQFIHENSSRNRDLSQAPAGVTSFTLGHFTMSLDPDYAPGGVITRKNISPAAYGKLLRAGLLYRGVER